MKAKAINQMAIVKKKFAFEAQIAHKCRITSGILLGNTLDASANINMTDMFHI